jgi:hypothetical protein
MTRARSGKKPAGFGRMDLLAVALMLAFGGGLLLASANRVRDAALRAQSNNNLKQIVIATIDCCDTFNGKIPPGIANWFPGPPYTPNNGYGPVLFHILPYIEQDPLYKSALQPVGNLPLYGAWNVADHATAVKTYLGPGDPTINEPADRSSYLANYLVFRRGGMRYPASIRDGVSMTIFYTEGYSEAAQTVTWQGQTQRRTVVRRYWEAPVWSPYSSGVMFQVAPTRDAADADLPQGLDPQVILVGMGDASTRSVNPAVTATTFFAACTPDDADAVGKDW